MPIKLIAPPEIEPVSIAEQKSQMKVTYNSEDSLIGGFIMAARQLIENLTGIRMMEQSCQLLLDGFPCSRSDDGLMHRQNHLHGRQIVFPVAPVSAVSEVRYLDRAGGSHLFPADQYLVDCDSIPGRIILKESASWPHWDLAAAQSVVISFTAGYGDEAKDVPEPLRLAVKLLAAHYFNNREAVIVAGGTLTVQELPLGIQQLITPYMLWRRD